MGSIVYKYRDPAAVALGLRELRRKGLTPRGICFVALDPRGETHIVIPENLDLVSDLKVGDKLALECPLEGRFFHFDAVHRLPGDSVLFTGDRRLSDTGSASEVACAISEWLKGSSSKNVFLGCTPHQPGAWWTLDQRSRTHDFHAAGFVDCVVSNAGVIARRLGEPHLYFREFRAFAEGGDSQFDGWQRCFTSDYGIILMLERRVQNYRLVLTCEDGLLEVDLSTLPESALETARVPMHSGFGVVGRIDGGAFAVTAGRVEDWGLADVSQAWLVGSPNQTILDLPKTLRATSQGGNA